MGKKFLNLLKKIPIDFGQASQRHTTKGKLIAFELAGYGNGDNKALDVGCRDGYFTKLLERRGYNVISMDVEKKFEKCVFIDANKPLPYQNNVFDLIWCSEVIEHLAEPLKVIEEFRRILSPDGIAVLTIPNSQFWLYKILKIFGLSPSKAQNTGHLHFFGINDVKKFKPEYICGFFPYIIFKYRITKLVNLLSPTFVFLIKKIK